MLTVNCNWNPVPSPPFATNVTGLAVPTVPSIPTGLHAYCSVPLHNTPAGPEQTQVMVPSVVVLPIDVAHVGAVAPEVPEMAGEDAMDCRLPLLSTITHTLGAPAVAPP